jgi:uncharacterized protein YceK
VLKPPVIRFGFITLIIMALLVSGCSSMKKNNKADALHYATLHYAKALRWNDYEGAMLLTRLPDGEVDDVDLDYLKNIKVTHYDVSQSVMADDEATGYVTLYLDYYNEYVNSVHSIVVDQTWKYDEELKQWLCATPMPKFKP